jgi:hypothetical protein
LQLFALQFPAGRLEQVPGKSSVQFPAGSVLALQVPEFIPQLVHSAVLVFQAEQFPGVKKNAAQFPPSVKNAAQFPPVKASQFEPVWQLQVTGAWSIPTAHQLPESVTQSAAEDPWSVPERLMLTFVLGNSIAARGY